MRTTLLSLWVLAIGYAHAQIEVTVYTYQAVPSQTDTSPLITADGSKIPVELLDRGVLRWVAVSEDLQQLGFPLGSEMYISNIGERSGVYEVRDLMNERHELSVDILICNTCEVGVWRKVKVYHTLGH